MTIWLYGSALGMGDNAYVIIVQTAPSYNTCFLHNLGVATHPRDGCGSATNSSYSLLVPSCLSFHPTPSNSASGLLHIYVLIYMSFSVRKRATPALYARRSSPGGCACCWLVSLVTIGSWATPHLMAKTRPSSTNVSKLLIALLSSYVTSTAI